MANPTGPAHAQHLSCSDSLLSLFTTLGPRNSVLHKRGAPLPQSGDAVASLPLPHVAHQQSFLGAEPDWTVGEVQLLREVQGGSGTYCSDRHKELLPLCDDDKLIEIILQGKKQAQHSAFSSMPMAEEELLVSVTLTVAFDSVLALSTFMAFHYRLFHKQGQSGTMGQILFSFL